MNNEELKDSISEEMKNILNDFKTEINEQLNDFKTEVKDDISSLKEDIAVLNDRMTKQEEITKSMQRSLIIIEQEHGEKISALFDYIVANQQKNDDYDKHFKENDRLLENHSARISNIEYTINNK